MLFRKLMRYRALRPCHVKHNNRWHTETQRVEKGEKKITNGFMSSNISIENRWVKRHGIEMFILLTLENTGCDFMPQSTSNADGRWTTMWKLFENNKLNFVRVQCGATNQEHELNAYWEKKCYHSYPFFTLTTDLTFHFTFMEFPITCSWPFPRRKCNISYLHSIWIRPFAASNKKSNFQWRLSEFEWVFGSCWFYNSQRRWYMIESI